MNNWYIITGGPSSGKTTLLESLGQKGYRILPEAARVYIDQQMEQGLTLEQIRADEKQFQFDVLKMKIALEKTLPPNELIFFDRGIPDSLAYYKFLGIDSDDFLDKAVKNSNYKKIFLLEMFPYHKDYARVESKEQALQIHNLLKESYAKLKIPMHVVPVMSLNQRVQFILNNL